ncbi:MAG: TolC family protein [Deltaproteobacteria bacterium]|nr:TolC family protein [Deltaproteobacteria bacterium]MBW2445637.1 TolC family protein [Deltaproteobacteria bacterium]
MKCSPAWRERGSRLGVLLGASLALLGAASPPPETLPDPLSLAWCLERAEVTNPDLDVARSTAEAAEARVYPAGALPDPRFRYELSNVPTGDLDLDSTPLSGQQLGLAQRLPFPGLLGNQRDAARFAADASQEELGDESRRVTAAVERAWVELGFAQRALDVTLENIDLVRQLAKIAEAKYRVGRGLQQDVIRAQVTLTELIDERIGREASIRSAEARLANLLDLHPEAPFPRTTSLREAASLPDVAALLQELESTSPRLRALARRIEEAEHRKRVAKFEGYPDFDLGLGYRIRQRVLGDAVNGDDFLEASVTIRLPVDRRKWRAKVVEQDALLRRSQANYRRFRAALRNAVRARYADLDRADQQIALLEGGLLPQARQSLDSSRSGYEVDKVDFLSLIDSQVRLLNAQLRLERAIADRRAAFAAVEASVGASLR